jgi:Tol biopolymer transport system component
VSAGGAPQIWIVEPHSAQPYRKLAEWPASARPRGLTWSKAGDRVLTASQEFSGDIVMYDITR